MTGPGEIFVTQLGRTSSRAALRFLRSRELSRDDQDDILGEAIAWCWEHRDRYSLVTGLETWFVNAVRHAHEKWMRNETREFSESLADIPTGDSTLASAAACSAVETLVSALPREQRRVLWLQMRGYSWKEIMARGVTERDVRDASARIKQLRRLIPSPEEYVRVVRSVPMPAPDEESQSDSDSDYEESEHDTTPWGTALGNWVQQQPGRTVCGVVMFEEMRTYASMIRERMNRAAGLDPKFMPDYVPTKHWRY